MEYICLVCVECVASRSNNSDVNSLPKLHKYWDSKYLSENPNINMTQNLDYSQFLVKVANLFWLKITFVLTLIVWKVSVFRGTKQLWIEFVHCLISSCKRNKNIRTCEIIQQK